MIGRLRTRYGASPLHLAGTLACFAVAGAAIVRWFDAGSDTVKILAWFAAAIVVHDLVALPLYSLIDRTGLRRMPGGAYLRVPAILSALLFVVFLPSILRLGSNTYHAASGRDQHPYLGRWLTVTAVLFALSGLVYLVRRRAPGRRRARPSPPRSPQPR